jgi:hypothetical protein
VLLRQPVLDDLRDSLFGIQVPDSNSSLKVEVLAAKGTSTPKDIARQPSDLVSCSPHRVL